MSVNPFSTKGDLTSWVQVSLAAALVDAVCARRGFEGRVNDIGKIFTAFALCSISALTLATVQGVMEVFTWYSGELRKDRTLFHEESSQYIAFAD